MTDWLHWILMFVGGLTTYLAFVVFVGKVLRANRRRLRKVGEG